MAKWKETWRCKIFHFWAKVIIRLTSLSGRRKSEVIGLLLSLLSQAQEANAMTVSTNPQFLIGRPPEKSGSTATALIGAAVLDLFYEWEEAECLVPTMTLV